MHVSCGVRPNVGVRGSDIGIKRVHAPVALLCHRWPCRQSSGESCRGAPVGRRPGLARGAAHASRLGATRRPRRLRAWRRGGSARAGVGAGHSAEHGTQFTAVVIESCGEESRLQAVVRLLQLPRALLPPPLRRQAATRLRRRISSSPACVGSSHASPHGTGAHAGKLSKGRREVGHVICGSRASPSERADRCRLPCQLSRCS